LPPELLAQKEDLLKDRVAIEMKRYFKSDFKRIGHAMRVARYAESIGKAERGNLAVILCAAYLHDIGIHEAERKHNSTAAVYQEQQGPPIARKILSKLNASEKLMDEVADIVGHHHHPRSKETINFKSVYDADLIANLEDAHKDKPLAPERLKETIANVFLTEAGRAKAQSVFQLS
jgi:HD superfamily phosphodiesterase